MLDILIIFIWIIQSIALITTAASIYVIIADPTEEIRAKTERVGHQSAKYLGDQLKFFKCVIFTLLVLGWFFGNPDNMGSFPFTLITVGVCWVIIGVIFVMTFIYGVVKKGKFGESALNTLRKSGINNIVFGIFITLLSYLLW